MLNGNAHENVSQKPDVAIVGELNPDLIVYGLPRELPEEREILATGFTLTLGSSSAILAHNLALLGSKVTFSSRIGGDVLGEMCRDRLREAGVEVDRVVRSTAGSNTGMTLILPLATTRRILTYPGTMFEMGIEDLDLDYLARARHFHLSSLFLHRKLSPQIPDLFREMKRRGLTTSLDTYDDPEDKWGGVLDEVLSLVDLLLCTEDELAKSQRQRTPRSMLRPKCRCWLSSAERAEHLPTRMGSGSTYLRSELMILIRWVRATHLMRVFSINGCARLRWRPVLPMAIWLGDYP